MLPLPGPCSQACKVHLQTEGGDAWSWGALHLFSCLFWLPSAPGLGGGVSCSWKEPQIGSLLRR